MSAARQGLLIAGGTGTRMLPLTRTVSKHLLAVAGHPLIHYPLCTLMRAGVRDIVVVSTPRDTPLLRELLGDGAALGLRLAYAVQAEPRGVADALLAAAGLCADAPLAVALGDNILHGGNLAAALAGAPADGATVFPVRVAGDASRYGVIDYDAAGRVLSLEEKPPRPRSDRAVPGLYLYDPDVWRFARELTPSPRGELEITDLNRRYLAEGRLHVRPLDDSALWLDVGTPEALERANHLVRQAAALTDEHPGDPSALARRLGR